MKTSNLIVRIPEPCHEDWNKMTPDSKGKFCSSCSKSVFDFSNKTDIEIRDILIEYKDQKVCGHFKKSQVNRPLNISINLSELPKNISVTKAFAIALFLVFGTFLFSCNDHQGKKVDKIEVTDSEKEGLTLGSLVVEPPPIESYETLSGDTMMTIDTLETVSYSETHVDGGISIEEMPYEEVKPIEEIKPVAKEEQTVETYVLGVMIMPYTEKRDTIINAPKDTIVIKDTQPKLSEETLIRSTPFGIYPNPGNGEFTVKYDVLKRADVRIDIYDMKGILLKTVVDVTNQHEGKYQIPVNLSELPNGIYLISLINNGKKSVGRLVIER